MYNKILIVFIGIVILLLGIFLFQYKDEIGSEETKIKNSPSIFLSQSKTSGYSRAYKEHNFIFPEDFGPHTDFQTEWWYYTGNLENKEGRHFGFQLTIFRRSLSPKRVIRESAWAANEIYFAHFAISDIREKQHLSSEKWNREALGLAGALSDPFKVWIDNWQIKSVDNYVKLTAASDNFSIDLTLEQLKSIVLHGEKGLSRKSSEPGNASYYYSQTRLRTEGTIEINGKKFKVSGFSWFDHEWSTSALSKNQVGWDWFSFQLDNGTELMLYQLRLKDGEPDKSSNGTFVKENGDTVHLTSSDFSIEVLKNWKSIRTNVVYPSKWRVKISKLGLEFTFEPYLSDQEIDHSFTYWEGAVKVKTNGKDIGNGFAELVGYE